MADPRYRNGVYTNTRGIREQQARDRRQAYANNHPLNHGWTFSYRNEEFDQAVYRLGDAKLMYHKDNWLVEYPHIGQVFYQGWTIEQVTEDAQKELAE